MNVLIFINQKIPTPLYGGSERIAWDLAKELSQRGHQITFLAAEGSTCDFAKMLIFSKDKPLRDQIPESTDLFHSFEGVAERPDIPYIMTMECNTNDARVKFDLNTVFVSRPHAAMYGSTCYVHNGLDWDRFPKPDLQVNRSHFHFLAKAAWRKKNIKGAVKITRMAGEKLQVMGGTRLNFKMGFRYTPYPSISFNGMVDDSRKAQIMAQSKGLLFPVLWNEPFGIALTESLYFGCPVFGTPYGSLTEIITPDVGLLSASSEELADAMKNSNSFNPVTCHEYARDLYGADLMTDRYLKLYDKVMNGETLNPTKPRLLQEQTEKFLPFT